MVYGFINDNKAEFGVRWLLRRIKLSANVYNNYLKGKKMLTGIIKRKY